MSVGTPFIPGQPQPHPWPLSRYLPPLPAGIVSTWLVDNVPSGTWILDPFGTTPQIATEAAQAGYRVLVAANNPVVRPLLEMAANPPTVTELRSALAELASSYKGSERLEPHIRSLYTTECAQCGRMVMADCFLWERQIQVPYAKIYQCLHCGDTGERPANNADQERAMRFGSGGLHRARALERVATQNDPDRTHAEEALSVYLPRAVYALFTLINKLEGLSLTPGRRRFLEALLLIACDQSNTLWPHPTLRERPRQLTIPPRFRENNVWLALEDAIELWASTNHPTPTGHFLWPEQPPPEGGISLFEGRLKDLAATLSAIDVGAVVSAVPRPNQAFWTLSALWSGWLWGREAAGPIKSVLRRRRYDWGWHTSALSAALSNLSHHIKDGTRFLGLIGESEPGFLTAAMLAAEGASFDLEGISTRAESGQTQITWRKSNIDSHRNEIAFSEAAAIAQIGAMAYLDQRGQPSPYLPLHAAALAALAKRHLLQRIKPKDHENPEFSPLENFSKIQAVLKSIFTFRSGFIRYEGSEQSLEVGQWWRRELGASSARDEPGNFSTPLADRVEIALVRYIYKHPLCSWTELDAALCKTLPGLITPGTEMIQVCLDSYGQQEPPGSGQWRLRTSDTPQSRRADLETARRAIQQLGNKLGYSVIQGEKTANQGLLSTASGIPYVWYTADGIKHYYFYIIASAAFGELAMKVRTPARQSIIVLPGGRANLVAYKLRNNPYLREEIDKGWRFLKYRHLRLLLESPNLDVNTLDEQLGIDPITYNTSQMRLL